MTNGYTSVKSLVKSRLFGLRVIQQERFVYRIKQICSRRYSAAHKVRIQFLEPMAHVFVLLLWMAEIPSNFVDKSLLLDWTRSMFRKYPGTNMETSLGLDRIFLVQLGDTFSGTKYQL